jgi:hypothetical protein
MIRESIQSPNNKEAGLVFCKEVRFRVCRREGRNQGTEVLLRVAAEEVADKNYNCIFVNCIVSRRGRYTVIGEDARAIGTLLRNFRLNWNKHTASFHVFFNCITFLSGLW